MTKATVAQLQLQLEEMKGVVEKLQHQVEAPRRAYRASTAGELADDPAARAAYVRQFFKRKRMRDNQRRMAEPPPPTENRNLEALAAERGQSTEEAKAEGTMATLKQRIDRLAAKLGVPATEISYRGGSFYHGKELVL